MRLDHKFYFLRIKFEILSGPTVGKRIQVFQCEVVRELIAENLMDAAMKKVIWIAMSVLAVVVVIYGSFRIIEVIGATKNNEVTAEG